MTAERCYVCGSDRFVDQHHLDYQGGAVSPLTVPLCRRCHRSYHDFGLECFSPDTTLKVLEVENIRRGIYHEAPMTIADVKRSSYWRKKWGIRRKRAKPPQIQLSLDIGE